MRSDDVFLSLSFPPAAGLLVLATLHRCPVLSLIAPALEGADYFLRRTARVVGGRSKAAGIRDKAGMFGETGSGLRSVSGDAKGLLVVRHGYLVFERYFGRANRNANPDMASTGKAFTSIACGIMLREFRDKLPEGLATKVFTEKYLPEAFPLDDPRMAEITLGQLLCMTGGYWGEGQAPTGIVAGKVTALQPKPGQNIRDLDMSSLRVPLWTEPGAGYSIVAFAAHASIMLRHVTGMELGLHQRAAGEADGLGRMGLLFAPRRFHYAARQWRRKHGAPRDRRAALRLCLPHGGKGHHLVPGLHRPLQQALAMESARPSRCNSSTADGHVAGAPQDAFYKSGPAAGISSSLRSIVIYKLGGKDAHMTGAHWHSAARTKPRTRQLAADPATPSKAWER